MLNIYTVQAASDLDFKEWTHLTNALRQVGVSTFSTTTHICPTCGTPSPPKWSIFIRPEDKDLVE